MCHKTGVGNLGLKSLPFIHSAHSQLQYTLCYPGSLPVLEGEQVLDLSSRILNNNSSLYGHILYNQNTGTGVPLSLAGVLNATS
jgi:hypothetical protein